MAILYLCNGKVEDCGKQYCYKRDEPCQHTTDPSNARNKTKRIFLLFGNDLWEADPDGI